MDENSAEQDIAGSRGRGQSAKVRLLLTLADDTWVMLQPSPVAGVGVFAVRDIPRGCRRMFSDPDRPEDWITVSRDEVNRLPAHARALVENYCLYDDHQYFVPAAGFKKMDLSLFLNHADVPNVCSVEDGAWFEATRDISAGEELFIDYGDIVDDPEAD